MSERPTPLTDAAWRSVLRNEDIGICDEGRVMADFARDLERKLAEARTALEDIAKQRLASEMDDHSSECADWEGGYEACVTTAREALALIDAKGKKTP